MVLDVERPLRLKPVPAVLTCENLIILLPVFLSVMVCELLVPMTTLPKFTLAGVAEICATLLAGFPVCPPLPAVYPAQLERLMEVTRINNRTRSAVKVPSGSLFLWFGPFARIASQCRESSKSFSTGRRAKERATADNCPSGQADLNHLAEFSSSPVFVNDLPSV